jgi:hypothetical protein
VKSIIGRGRFAVVCASASAATLLLAAAAAPASADQAGTSSAPAPRFEVSGARASHDPPESLELLLEVLGLSVQISNGYLGASGPADLVQLACDLPLSETDGLGSVCLFSGDNETGNGLIVFPGDSVPAGTCMYIYADVANFSDNANQPWDLGSVDGNCENGGTVDALDQAGQDENVSPPVDYGVAIIQFDLSEGDDFSGEPEEATFSGG